MTRPDIPQEFKDYARRLLGAERYARFAQALDEDPSVSVRLNPFKAVWSGLLLRRWLCDECGRPDL